MKQIATDDDSGSDVIFLQAASKVNVEDILINEFADQARARWPEHVFPIDFASQAAATWFPPAALEVPVHPPVALMPGEHINDIRT